MISTLEAISKKTLTTQTCALKTVNEMKTEAILEQSSSYEKSKKVLIESRAKLG